MATAYLSLGSNIGRRKSNLQKALTLLEECGLTIIKKSHVYETQAVSKIDQRDFLNMCVEIQTDFTPEKLRIISHLIENQMGRTRSSKKNRGYEEPRIIDIDILLYDQKIVNKRNLHIPHKRMHERKFVLVPLNEIAPHFRHPVQQKTIFRLLNDCPDSSIVKS
jgi:2-amino-4-hydroxy-6-hydroxymethyldihydropteridine diphosphokinase